MSASDATSTDADVRERGRALLAKVPPAPRPISPAAHERIFAPADAMHRGGLRGTVLWVGACVAVAFLAPDVRLLWRGEPATGEVVSSVRESGIGSHGRHAALIRFRYVYKRTPGEAGLRTYDDELIAELPVGKQVAVEVDRESPDVARLRGQTTTDGGYMPLMVFAFPPLMILTALVSRSLRRRLERACTVGTPVVARVTHAEDFPKGLALPGTRRFQLRWEFELDGRHHVGALTSKPDPNRAPEKVGQEIVVLVLPEQPGMNTLYVP